MEIASYKLPYKHNCDACRKLISAFWKRNGKAPLVEFLQLYNVLVNCVIFEQ